MTTRCLIAKRDSKGAYWAIYCHWDGYPSWTGKTLHTHYKDPQKVDALLNLGDLSSLGEEIGKKHDFNNTAKEWCTAYHRDRNNEEFNPPKRCENIEDLVLNLGQACGADYVYTFVDNKWTYYSRGNGMTEFDILTEEPIV